MHDHEATYAGEFDDGLTELGRSGTEHFSGSVGGPVGAYASRDL